MEAVSPRRRMPTIVVPIERTQEVPDPTDTWTVQRGDHLWGIAEETLADGSAPGPTPSQRQVAHYWQRLIEENRDVIGPDPDVIHPGVTLVLPEV